ncbi:glycosyltransferase family 39 protein [Candidatus Woesearchaeota archaeon]|nr:glycosyltransferase family 39 protein [Candidatus Woesearchaeota archaeon]
MQNIIKDVKLAWIKRNKIIILFFLLVVIFFNISYFTNALHPINYEGKGFYGWWDQSQYLRMAKEISKGDLQSNEYNYGLAYPLLAVPFVKLIKIDPFYIPNLILFILTILFTYKSTKILLNQQYALFSVLLLATATNIILWFIVPWRNSITIVSTIILFFLYLRNKNTWFYYCIIGIIFGINFSAGYIDVLLLGPLFVVSYFRPLKFDFTRNNIIKHIPAVFIGTLIVGLTLFSHHYYFGSIIKTPYAKHTNKLGANDQSIEMYDMSNIFSSLKETLYSYPNRGNDRDPLFISSPIILLALVGIPFLFKNNRSLIIGLVLSIMFTIIFYGSFPSFSGNGLSYHCIRYVSNWVPPLICIGMVGISRIIKENG